MKGISIKKFKREGTWVEGEVVLNLKIEQGLSISSSDDKKAKQALIVEAVKQMAKELGAE